MNHSEMMEEGHNPIQCKGGILKNVPKVRSQETNNMIVKKMGREKTTCQKKKPFKGTYSPLRVSDGNRTYNEKNYYI